MSGSPPLPLRSAHEAGSRGEAPNFYATPRLIDGLRGGPAQPSPTNMREQASLMTRPYPQEPTTRSPYSYPRPEESGRIVPYPPQHHHVMPQGVSSAPYLNSVSSNSDAYPVPDRSQAAESQPFTSPKSQRKTKGHVASACVPCKKAHLRCDAQRPCSRCLGNGKEEACVDVQHKKRGRPRLRDERDARFDPTRYSHPQDAALRRPLSIYPSAMAGLSPYEDSLRRNQSYRALEHPTDASREYQERSMAPDPNLYNPSYPGTPHAMEPLAYLSMEFDIVKASPMFMDIVHASSPLGNKLSDIVAPHQANFLTSLQNQLFEEQRLHEPNYLPPMLGRLDLAIKDFGFTSDDVARFRLNHVEYFSFVGYDGYTRTFPLRFGLAKEGSFYFVVFLLSLQQPHPQLPPPLPSQHHTPHQHHQQYPHHPPQRQHSQHSQHGQHVQHPPYTQHPQHSQHTREPSSIRSPQNSAPSNTGTNSGVPAYTHSQYSGSSYQTSQSDHVPTSRPATQPTYQLPPIRAQPDHRPSSREVSWPNGERPRRVDIGGLLDQPSD
ncbi:uncharacterized protein TRIVIDRAFT_169905, partial [Trichoderma virens Gv29-8]